jgi:hypothetical protein
MMTFLVVRRDMFVLKNSAHKSSSTRPRDASPMVDMGHSQFSLEKQLHPSS